jgi:ATP-dependent DNA ligase
MLTKEHSKLPALRPSFIEPMYARAVSELPEGNLWSYEAKLDGYRWCCALVAAGQWFHDPIS